MNTIWYFQKSTVVKYSTMGFLNTWKKRLKEVRIRYLMLDILEINHDIDHIHMLIVIPPKMSVGQVGSKSFKIKYE